MTLEEAIKHCEEVAEKNEKECKNWAYGASQINDDENRKKQYQKHAEMWHECANEHRQLAEWLRELKYRRSYENGCQYCKYKVRSDEDEPCIICSHNYTDKFKDDGTREVNADDT